MVIVNSGVDGLDTGVVTVAQPLTKGVQLPGAGSFALPTVAVLVTELGAPPPIATVIVTWVVPLTAKGVELVHVTS